MATRVSREHARHRAGEIFRWWTNFAPPVRVSENKWVLNGCPENGPAVAVDKTNAIHVVWPTFVQDSGGTETLALFYATSRDGQRFTKRAPTEGVPRHPQIAVGPAGRITVTWDEQMNGAPPIVVARAAIDRVPVRFTREFVTEEAGAYPALASSADGVLVAATTGATAESTLRVMPLPAK